MADEHPPPPPDALPTPSGTRKPMPSIELLDRAQALSHSELRKMSPDEQRIVMHERTKNLESGMADLSEHTRELRFQVGNVVAQVSLLASNQVAMTKQLADHASKIEWLLKRVGVGGGVLGFVWFVLKIAELATR